LLRAIYGWLSNASTAFCNFVAVAGLGGSKQPVGAPRRNQDGSSKEAFKASKHLISENFFEAAQALWI